MPETKATLTPFLACQSASEAIEFYKEAFGAEPVIVVKTPQGQVMHATLSMQGCDISVNDEWPDQGCKGPLRLGGTPVTLHLNVPNCDEVFQHAVDAGCKVRMPLEDMFWGDRYGQVTDPYGHQWSIATTIRQLSPEEMQKAAETFMAQCAEGCG
ncbi:MAG TPA: VOC family protein [Armatimonadota bacterium]